jgi:hypothetical protein
VSNEQADTIHALRSEMLALEPLQTPESAGRVAMIKREIDLMLHYDNLRRLIEEL